MENCVSISIIKDIAVMTFMIFCVLMLGYGLSRLISK